MQNRVNRATTAQFVFDSGCIGQLFHSVTLEGARFSAELDIQAEGLHIVIGNPYHMPFLRMRSSRIEDYQEVSPAIDQGFPAAVLQHQGRYKARSHGKKACHVQSVSSCSDLQLKRSLQAWTLFVMRDHQAINTWRVPFSCSQSAQAEAFCPIILIPLGHVVAATRLGSFAALVHGKCSGSLFW